MSDYIVVRDRRQPRQFSICNVIIDQWYPIIGAIGYSLYSLYVRMARIDDERCWPGYTMIGLHLRIRRSSISEHNHLLQWCKLIHVEEGDRNHANNYYILDVPEVTVEAMQHIRQEAIATLSPQSRILATIERRLDAWEPIQALWSKTSRRIEVVRPGQMILPGCEEGGSPAEHPGSPAEHPGSPAEHPGSPAEHPGSLAEHCVRPGNCNNPKEQSKPTIQRDNPQQQGVPACAGMTPDVAVVEDFLRMAGIAEPMRSDLAQRVDWITVRAWSLYAETQDLANPPGFVVSVLRGRKAPPAEFVRLAKLTPAAWYWLEKNASTRDLTGVWTVGMPVDEELAEMWYEMYYREVEDGGA